MSSKKRQHHHQSHSFETAQLQNLQSMIELLAQDILISFEQKEKTVSSNVLPKFRVYAQYLNLYMKFKEKSFPKTQPSNNPDVSASKLQASTHSSQPNHNHSSPLQPPIQQAVQNAKKIVEQNRLHHTNQTTALLMQPVKIPE